MTCSPDSAPSTVARFLTSFGSQFQTVDSATNLLPLTGQGAVSQPRSQRILHNPRIGQRDGSIKVTPRTAESFRPIQSSRRRYSFAFAGFEHSRVKPSTNNDTAGVFRCQRRQMSIAELNLHEWPPLRIECVVMVLTRVNIQRRCKGAAKKARRRYDNSYRAEPSLLWLARSE